MKLTLVKCCERLSEKLSKSGMCGDIIIHAIHVRQLQSVSDSEFNQLLNICPNKPVQDRRLQMVPLILPHSTHHVFSRSKLTPLAMHVGNNSAMRGLN
jgi:hypothetical protein